ncbi:MAG TPA: phosphoglycerate kinase [Streptosporangiaceae bacterium]
MKAIDDLDVTGRRVLLRLDLDVPIVGGRVVDDTRIRASLPTLTKLLSRDAKVVICAHRGRPGGRPDPRYSLAPVAARLSVLLGRPVVLAASTAGTPIQAAVEVFHHGGVVMLENLRYNAGETSKDDTVRGRFADELAALADAYASDGFGAVHRKHASVYDVPLRLPHAAGYLIQAEVAALSRLTGNIRRPYVVVLGGAKVAGKIRVIGGLMKLADRIVIGGAMAFPFLAAQGHKVGTSPLNPAHVDLASGLLEQAGRVGVRIVLPSDVLVAAECTAEAPREVADVDAIPADQMALDIGPRSARSFAAEVAAAGTAFWNGPMGVFELAPYAAGTRAVIRGLTAGGAFTVVGGGDTAAALGALGVTESVFNYVSTCGGASLEFLAGKTLPGLISLQA